jgi:hypothetical protein
MASIITLSPIGYEKDASDAAQHLTGCPSNWLRMAPQDPEDGLGRAPEPDSAGMAYNDWEVEEPYTSSRMTPARSCSALLVRRDRCERDAPAVL